MAYPTIIVGTANPNQTLINKDSFVGPMLPQPKVVVGPAKPTATISKVGQVKPTQTIKNTQVQPQQIQGVIGASPFQEQPRTAFQSYWKLLTEPVIAPSKLGLSFTKGVAQGTAKGWMATTMDIARGEQKIQQKVFGNVIGLQVPPSVYNKYLYGEVPARGLTSEGSEIFSAVGADSLSKNKTASFALGAVLAGLDFTPGGKGDDLVKILAKTEDISKIVKELTKFGIADDVIKEYAPVISSMKNQKEIQQVVEQMKRAQAINPTSGLKKLNISEDAKKVIQENVDVSTPILEKTKGGKITRQEVISQAENSKILTNKTSRKKTLVDMGSIHRTRESAAALAEQGGVSGDLVDQIEALSTLGTSTARTLRSFGFEADPLLKNPKIEIIKKLLDEGVDKAKIVAASEGVDFSKTKEVTKFYRSLVPAKWSEVLSEFRYGNMLSSPLTHSINFATNTIQGTILNPATKVVSGLIDNVISKIARKEQNHFVSEAGAVYKGIAENFGKALNEGWAAFRGNRELTNLDIQHISTNSPITAVHRQFLQALEAGDAFARTLIKEAEKSALISKYTKQGKAFTQASIDKEADAVAKYFIFRNPTDALNKSGQGAFLANIDKVTNAVNMLKDVPIVGWFVPFVQTPMNILKQGIEYSPAGVFTLPKNADKVQQLSKTLIGSTVFAGAGYMALQDRTTWGVPTNEKEKELFYASGMQPYSVKIGDKWFSYSKLGPLAYPVAMAAAVKYYWQDNPKSVTQTDWEKFSQISTGILKFFGDQSYIQGISELADFTSGKPGSGVLKTLENLSGQIVPLSSLQRWVNNIIDPVFRKTDSKFNLDSVLKNLEAQIVFLSDVKEPFKTSNGEDSKRPYPVINALNPYKVSPENSDSKEKFNLNNEILKLTNIKASIKDEAKQRIEPVYEEVQRLVKDNKMNEAQKIVNNLSKEDYQIYQSIKQSKKAEEISSAKPEMLGIYKQVQLLKESGRMGEAQNIVSNLSPEQYDAYKAIKKLVEDASVK